MNRRIFIHRSFFALALTTGVKGISCSGGREKKGSEYLIKQFEDTGLAQFSYAVEAENKIVLIDPARDPQPYYAYASARGARIIGVVETHPHADFVSGHLQIHREKNVPIYVSALAKVSYPSERFDDGDTIKISNDVVLRALNTPGHSPDSISIVLQVAGKDIAVFSGDALLLGGVGRPDLREYSGEAIAQRYHLARQMYHSLFTKYSLLDDDVIVYPAHGAGTLCATALSDAKQSTIGHEKQHNTAFQKRAEDDFVRLLLAEQPIVPAYFPFDVEINKKGATDLSPALDSIPTVTTREIDLAKSLVIDTRPSKQYHGSHLKGSINIPERAKSETWVGTLVEPERGFFVVVDKESEARDRLAKLAKIGYEGFVQGVMIYQEGDGLASTAFNKENFDRNQQDYHILDVRNASEVESNPVFKQAKHIALADLTQALDRIPTDKPIAVHCASGYRSAIASSIIKKYRPEVEVIDIGEEIKGYSASNKKANDIN
ncbi:MBL fold metallo-hydrolase [Sphingobacterium bambusae]|uniref:Rhodanese-like domain-containing protein n=1 Tax=Sphingobacterium bambusae TaxID=662858 RepID=A0ABW6BBQ8_9SPHI|nr:MBL fold metallo-hydrolase [Sphingobacterium bambusae]WPL48663.1 MBL fold metallo-hydrolase [Sphingobacterium bambusae]